MGVLMLGTGYPLLSVSLESLVSVIWVGELILELLEALGGNGACTWR